MARRQEWANDLADKLVKPLCHSDPEWQERIVVQNPGDQAAALSALCWRVSEWEGPDLAAELHFVQTLLQLCGGILRHYSDTELTRRLNAGGPGGHLVKQMT